MRSATPAAKHVTCSTSRPTPTIHWFNSILASTRRRFSTSSIDAACDVAPSRRKGAIDERWFSDLDIRIQQEIPFFRDSKAKIYIDIENVLNLIDDDMGRKTFINTDIASAVGVVDATIDPGTNTYIYQEFRAPEALPDTFDSLWRLQLGIRADF